MSGKPYTIDDFKKGEKVYPRNIEQLTLEVIGIDKERRKVICQLTGGKLTHEFNPEDLEKENKFEPGKKKNGNKETQEES